MHHQTRRTIIGLAIKLSCFFFLKRFAQILSRPPSLRVGMKFVRLACSPVLHSSADFLVRSNCFSSIICTRQYMKCSGVRPCFVLRSMTVDGSIIDSKWPKACIMYTRFDVASSSVHNTWLMRSQCTMYIIIIHVLCTNEDAISKGI